ETGAAARLQILATEHWSLLATRSLTYNEALSRVTIFLAILPGAVIALALVAQADGFGPTTISIAIPVLCVVLFAGVVTVGRLIRLNSDDYRWVIGMNRLRHAYIEMHPDLAVYFVASPYDDAAGALQTLGIEHTTMASTGAGSILHLVQTLPGMVAIVVACVAPAFGALGGLALHGSLLEVTLAAAIGFVLVIAVMGIWARQAVRHGAPILESRFPSPHAKDGNSSLPLRARAMNLSADDHQYRGCASCCPAGPALSPGSPALAPPPIHRHRLAIARRWLEP